MRKRINGKTAQLWASAHDTYDWAHRSGNAWPCSTLSHRRFYAEFSNGDLVNIVFNGGRGEQDCDAQELNAFVEDAFGTSRPGEA
jgi:hypothetical protein